MELKPFQTEELFQLPKSLFLRACDFFDLFVFFAPDQMFFSPLQKGVILSEALRRSVA
jgi:hypothetical protein